ncbi:DUF1822 family protein [Trichocoleus sp. FACHB-591]|uniref:DUF1822 family protein n=1 Tax=Trichocoleus sp. FACHB-591 TaxID=2692872 RepID=UPI001687A929|nr:DUF1822 family protein [Trichocoleus sp. FACHB-591]
MFVFAKPTEWWLEVSSTVEVESWQRSQQHSTFASRWSAYLNQVCLQVLLAWIRAEYDSKVTTWLDSLVHPAIWEVVNGSAITIGSTRLVLIPAETMDDAELEVPQEWVDIPSWVADYYLAVQVKLDAQSSDRWVRFWGYTTHQALKSEGHYDPDDRTYCMEARQLTQDLSTLWVTLQFCSEQTRAAIAPLSVLNPIQAENLIQRLGNSAIAFPRLMVPFTLWGALMENPAWRQQLYQQRSQNQEASAPRQISLSQWLQGQLSIGWQTLETLLGVAPEAVAVSLRSRPNSELVETVRVIELESATPPQSVLLLMALKAEVDGRIGILVQLHPGAGQTYVPANLILLLLSDTGESLQSVQADDQDNYIQLKRFKCSPDTQFRLQVVLDGYSVTEDFVV